MSLREQASSSLSTFARYQSRPLPLQPQLGMCFDIVRSHSRGCKDTHVESILVMRPITYVIKSGFKTLQLVTENQLR